MSERDVMAYDVAIVGAGPAGLACALRMKQQNADLNVCVLEKASAVGAHALAGAVIETEALTELVPNWRDNPPPICVPVEKDEILWMTEKGATKLPMTPPQMNNHGNFIVSLGAMTAWLGDIAEEAGVEIFPGFAAAEALVEDGKVIGIRTGDMGVGKDGGERDGYALGIDIHADLTVFAEGCRGSVSKQLIKQFELDKDASPQTYGIGIKELWQLAPGKGSTGLVQHTVGWPLKSETYGGSFIYHLEGDKVAMGFVVGLDYKDTYLKPFDLWQELKAHPKLADMFEGAELLNYGARAIVEGGWQSMPKLEVPGAMLIGDGGGMLNVPKIKGIHIALRSGILAAEHYHEKKTSEGWDGVLRSSVIAKELKKVRNIRPGFKWGLYGGFVNAGWETVTMGLSPWTLANHADHSSLRKVSEGKDQPTPPVDTGIKPKDRLSAVYYASTEHDEEQPVHLHVADTNICVTQCAEEYDNPCTRFCPANVYEMVEEPAGKRLQINAANCVHCKTCDIKDPYQIINWVTPEGGSGPNYSNM